MLHHQRKRLLVVIVMRPLWIKNKTNQKNILYGTAHRFLFNALVGLHFNGIEQKYLKTL